MASARKTEANEDSFDDAGSSLLGRPAIYNTSGEDFSSLSNWEVDNGGDLGASGDNYSPTLEIKEHATSFHSDGGVTFNGSSNNDATHHHIIRPVSGEGHDGTTNNGAGFDVPNGDWVILNDPFIRIEDLILTATQNDANANNGVETRSAGGNDLTLVGILVFDADNTDVTGTWNNSFRIDGSDTFVILCLSDNCENHGMHMHGPSGNAGTLYQSLAVDNGGDGFKTAVANNTVKNCYGKGNNNDYTGTWTAFATTASLDSTSPDTGRRTVTATFVSEAGNDWHLSGSDTGLTDDGTDLSSDGTFAFDDDINDGRMGAAKSGESFDDWDIGIDEPDPTGVAALPKGGLALIGVGI